MTDFRFSAGTRALQRQFGTEALAERAARAVFRKSFTEGDRRLIESTEFFFMATTDATGQPQCSYKGGERGFVKISGDQELVFPLYEGNGLFLSAGNIAESRAVGLLFIDFERQKRLRVNGTADLFDRHPALLEEAQLVVRLRVTDIHPNCRKRVRPMIATPPSST